MLGEQEENISPLLMLAITIHMGVWGLAVGLRSQLWEGSEMLAAVSDRHAGQSHSLLLVKDQIGSVREEH